MIRKAVIVLLALAALGSAGLWVDSYRLRKQLPLTPEREARIRYEQESVLVISAGPIDLTGIIGIDLFRSLENRRIIRLRSCQGRFYLRYYSIKPTGTFVKRIASSWGGFGHERWGRRNWIRSGHQSKPDAYEEYLVREVAVPFWFLLVAFAPYPTLAFIRGPFRCWRRRRKGCCIRCGYNLTGNVSGRCPECGQETQVERPGT